MKNNELIECNRSSKVIRIDADVADEIECLAKETRTPAKEIASKAIRFALVHVVKKPVECYDIEFVERMM